MGYKILKDFRLDSVISLLRIAACLLQAWTSSILPVCSALFLRYSRWFLRVSRSSVQKHFYLFTLPLWMQALAQLMMLLLMTLPFLSGCCEKSILSWCRFISNMSVKLPQSAVLKFQEVLTYESDVLCCRVRGILAITGLCPDPMSSSMMRFVFVLMSLDRSRRSGVVWAPLKLKYVDGSVSLSRSTSKWCTLGNVLYG